MGSIILLGYSGHAFVIADAVLALGRDSLYGYFDREKKERNPFQLTFLGPDSLISGMEQLRDKQYLFFPAVGSCELRKRFLKEIKENELNTLVISHPNAWVSPNSIIGTATFISAGACINAFAKIGEACIINTNATIEHECHIGPFGHIAPGATLAGNVHCDDSVFIGANAVIKEGVFIGSNVKIGAGAVVIKDAPEGVWVGNPAKRIA